MSELVQAVISPLGFFVCFMALGLVVTKIRGLAMGMASLGLLFFSLPIVAYSLILSLESRHPPLNLSNIPESDWAILLGGGLNTPGNGIGRSELGSSGDRLALIAELFLNHKVRRILVTSGSGYENYSEAKQTAELLRRWGIPATAITVETKSRNTVENASFAKRYLSSHGNQPSLLVTSAWHMPRARALFCAQGIDVISVTANHWVRPEKTIKWHDWIPRATSLNGSSRALNEYMSILYHALTGRLSINTLNHDHSCV